jgi:quercetin dioxygenase-like cupin family protein
MWFSKVAVFSSKLGCNMGLVDVSGLKELQIVPGIMVRAINTQTVTVLHVRITTGAFLPENSHHNEQVLNVIDGELELEVDGRQYILGPGMSFELLPTVVHSGRALSDCTVIDVFHPAREEFMGGTFEGYSS